MINIRKLEAELCESADMLHAGSKLRLQHRQPPAPLLQRPHCRMEHGCSCGQTETVCRRHHRTYQSLCKSYEDTIH